MKPDTTTLTPPQEKVLRFIVASINKDGLAPTRMEIAKRLGVASVNTADFHVKALAKKGFIRLTESRNRNITLCQ